MPRGKGINMRNKGKKCKVRGCNRNAACKGYCKSHYNKHILKEKKKTRLEDGFKNEYNSVSDLVDALPSELYFRKFKIEEQLIIFIYQSQKREEDHTCDITAIFVEYEDKIKKVEQEKLRQELAKILLKKFSPDKFIEDFLETLMPEEIFEAYTRAVVKKGKVREKEGCYKFQIFGTKGHMMELMLRN